MYGCMTICTVHRYVYNAERRQWQKASRRVLAELKAMAKELGNVEIYESVCPVCNPRASESFHGYHRMRVHEAAYKELSSEITPACFKEDIE